MRIEPHTYKLICEPCDGDGRFEVYIDCGKPASICCGGCSETVECPDCDGKGFIVLDCYDLPEHIECIDCTHEETLTNHE